MALINPPGFPIERGKIHEFANSILDDNPLYHDEEAAKAAGLPSVVAPPTYASVGSFYPAGAGGRPGREGLDMRYVLHGGSEWIFERPLFPGDILTSEPGETTETTKEGRRGGKMRLIESETIYRDQHGEIVLRLRGTTIQTEGVVQDR